ncbi:hypothetical protein [uncultured Varibaculum sp.]|uniref:hypothetical protein n=1 Tax=uncultured Varibaculum sp. TaxID=413896 RepID=UPI00288BDA21|nr:hypothetical protein [uncultured Varibaculum sp.]
MTSRIGKRTIAILAFIALGLSVIIPLSIPKAFSAPDCHRAEVKDYQAKIDKVVADFTAKIKKDGSYGYGVHNGRVFSPALDSIVPGFGEGREIDRIIEDSKYSLVDILGEGAFGNGMSNAHQNEDGTTTSDGSFGIFSPKKTVDEAKLKEVITSELAEFLKAHPRQICPGKCKNAEEKDFEGKIDKMVSDLAAKVKEKGEYVYSGQHFPELNSIAPGFGMYREITKVIKGNGYTFEDIFGQGAKFKAVSLGSGGGLETPKVEIHLTSPTKTFDEAKFKDAVSKELAKFLKEHPREICEPDKDEPIVEPTKPSEPTTKPTGDNPKPGCHKAEVKDYAAGIEKVVDEIEASKHQKEVTGKVESEHGAKSFLTVFYVYEWNTAILRQINPGITDRFVLTEEQTKQVFGDGAKSEMTAMGAPPAIDEHGNTIYPGEGSETFHAENATKFDREAMAKVITDKVAEFLAKNPQEICEGGSDTKPGDTPEPGTNEPTVEPTTPGNDTKPGDTTEPGNTTEPGKDEPTVEPTKPGTTDPTTEPTKPGDDSKPGDTTEPGDTPKPGTTEPTTPGNDNKPGNDTKSGTDTKPGNDTKPGETSKDSKTPAPKANNGSQNAPEGTDTNGDSQTVLEGATEAGGLATTGAVGLITLGVSVLLVGAGAALAIRRRKQNV